MYIIYTYNMEKKKKKKNILRGCKSWSIFSSAAHLQRHTISNFLSTAMPNKVLITCNSVQFIRLDEVILEEDALENQIHCPLFLCISNTGLVS